MQELNIQNYEVYSVSALNQLVKTLLEDNFPAIWVEGELSNIAQPYSGHVYFSLKDAHGQIRAAMFKHRNRYLNFKLEEGLQVLVRGKLSLYAGRGDYQIIVDDMEPTGDGALRRAYEKLKQKLDKAGFFAEEQKKSLPKLAQCIGVITSATGAAIRDVLSILKRRCPSIPIIIYPTQVQGSAAATELCRAIAIANQRQECDVLLLTRGGGSLEDLWPFNEETLAKAIYHSKLPIVSAVGHEVDFTIADFVADARAATPSAGAELLSPVAKEWLTKLSQQQQRLHKCLLLQFQQLQQHLQHLKKRLKHPGQRLQEYAQHLDYLEQNLKRNQQNQLDNYQYKLVARHTRLLANTPVEYIRNLSNQQQTQVLRLQNAMRTKLREKQEKFANCYRALQAINPLATLARGYSITRDTKHNIIKTGKKLKPGDEINTQLHQGSLRCKVLAINE